MSLSLESGFGGVSGLEVLARSKSFAADFNISNDDAVLKSWYRLSLALTEGDTEALTYLMVLLTESFGWARWYE